MKTVDLRYPIKIDGEKVKKINMDLEGLDGSAIMKIEQEMLVEGKGTLKDLISQDFFLRVASKSSNMHKEDLEKLKWVDFVETTASVRNFLYGFSETNLSTDTEEATELTVENSEDSTTNLEKQVTTE